MRFYYFSLAVCLFSCGSKTEIVEKYANGKPSKITEHLEKDSSSEKIFYPNGILEELRSFKEGKQTGKQIFYRADGSEASISTFIEGEKNGPMYEYYSSGQISAEGTYSNGKMEGPCKTYFRNGKPNYIGSFHLGKDTGWSYYFNPDGDTTRMTFRKSPSDSMILFNGRRQNITPNEWEKMANNELLLFYTNLF